MQQTLALTTQMRRHQYNAKQGYHWSQKRTWSSAKNLKKKTRKKDFGSVTCGGSGVGLQLYQTIGGLHEEDFSDQQMHYTEYNGVSFSSAYDLKSRRFNRLIPSHSNEAPIGEGGGPSSEPPILWPKKFLCWRDFTPLRRQNIAWLPFNCNPGSAPIGVGGSVCGGVGCGWGVESLRFIKSRCTWRRVGLTSW